MIEKQPLCPDRRRKITGSFAFIEHRFLRDGFWSSTSICPNSPSPGSKRA